MPFFARLFHGVLQLVYGDFSKKCLTILSYLLKNLCKVDTIFLYKNKGENYGRDEKRSHGFAV